MTKLDSISHQLNVVAEKPIGGKPTAIEISAKLIAIGTVRGLIALFDRKTGHLVQFMHDKKEKCPVSALCFTPNGQKIAVGFSRGSLRIYRTTNDKLVDERLEAVQPGHGILHVVYISNSTLLLIDSAGNAFEYREGRRSGTRCIFTGCKGEAVNVHFVPSEKLLLLCTLKQVLLFNSATGTMKHQLRLLASPDAPPLMSSFVRRTQITSRAIATDTRFCLARGQSISVFQAQTNAKGQFVCPLVKVIELSDRNGNDPTVKLNQLIWLDEHHLLVSDTREQLSLIDVNRGKLIGNISISDVHLVYGTANFKGLSTGGNVSEALRCLSANVCYQSIRHHDSEAFLLGQNGVFKICVADQLSQLERFVQRGEIASALLFAIDVHGGRIADRSRQKQLRSEVSTRLPDLICQLLDITTDGLTHGTVANLVDHYKRHIYVLIRACVMSSNFRLLYDTVYRRLEADPLSKNAFMELLEEFVIEGQLYEPPADLIRDYLSYLSTENQMSLFETAVTRMPIASLDLHQVITTCRQNQLFDGIIFVMNHVLGDYIGPLEEMCENLSRFVDKSVFSDWEVALGNKVLLYLNCCLAGRAYPYGQLSSELADVVAIESYRYMIALRNKSTNSTDTNDEKYPRLQLFLRFDAQQFLNVICTCSDATIFAGSDGRLKRFVDILVGLSEEQIPDLGPLLLSFIAHLLHKNAIGQDDQHIESLILRTMERVSTKSDAIDGRRVQNQMEHSTIELLRATSNFPLDTILQQARKLPFVLICTYIYTIRKQYVNLLICCMEDASNPGFVFDVILDLFGAIHGQELKDLRRFVEDSMIRLNKIDSMRTANLFLDHFIETIASAPHLPFDLLFNCFTIRRKQGSRIICGDEEADDLLFRSLFEAAINRGHLDVDDFAHRLSNDELDLELAELLDYWMPIGTHDDSCLNAAVRARLLECRIRLLVARQHYSNAFKLLFESLQSDVHDSKLFERRIRLFLQLAAKCQQEARESEWLLRLFRLILETQDGSKRLENFDSLFSELLTTIIENGVGSGNVEKVVELMFSHEYFSDASYSSFSTLIKKMLLSCEMDELMLESTIEGMRYENFDSIAQLSCTTKMLHCPLIECDHCVYCKNELTQSFLVFNCSHLSHVDCADENNRKCPCSRFNSINLNPVAF
ncbi:Vacuolar protein sorting-associated protein 8-like protein [Aphelenchoides besseyi]|nr:Vacuolar protein sorting-associated protein 8-like protein [Aphelenchoides besseyi]